VSIIWVRHFQSRLSKTTFRKDSFNVYRWIKFEEDVEEGGERWSKPHVATLSLHSLFELRRSITTGTILLDTNASTIFQVAGM
jgi:hypothetical protein